MCDYDAEFRYDREPVGVVQGLHHHGVVHHRRVRRPAAVRVDREHIRSRTPSPGRGTLGVAAYRHLADARTAAPDTGSLRGDALELLRRANAIWSSPRGAILRDLLAAVADEPALLELLREQAGGGAMNAAWFAILSRAVARGEAPPEAVHPRVATLPMALLRGEYALRGVPAVPDEVLVEIVDEIVLPLVRGRGVTN